MSRRARTERQEVPEEIEATATDVVHSAFEVHRQLGPGLVERVYQRALIHELNLRGRRVQLEVPITVCYKGLQIEGQRLDLLVEPGVVVELKSVEQLLAVHKRQLVSYLRSSGHRLGFLINFNMMLIRDGIKRVVN